MLGYTVVVLHLLTGIIFSAVTTVFIARESGNFVCDVRDTPSDKDYVRLQCYEKYKGQYSPFPLFGFALLSFGIVIVVCIAYSFSVKSRIERMEACMKPDPENPRRRQPLTNRHKVFWYYALHLAFRVALGIAFIVLQLFIYPSTFPTAFDCGDIKARKPTATPASNSTTPASNSTDDPTRCHFSSQNAPWAKAILAINIIVTLLVFSELCLLGYRVKRNKAFIQDFDFCKQHLNLFSKPLPTPETPDSFCLEPLIVNSESTDKTNSTTENIVDVLIHTGTRDKKLEDWIEQREIPKTDLKTPDLIEQLSLFEASEDTKSPRNVLIVGGPGIGKSVQCEKLLQDVTNKEELLTADNKRFKYSYLFQFKSFNLTSEVSLKTLLYRKGVDSDRFQDILDNSEKVLLVFDGLDEFMHHADLKTEYKRAQAGSATEEMPFLSLYANLLNNNQNLLPKATVVTTCRTSVWQSVNEEWFSRIAEIRGYTHQTVNTYINKFCKRDSDSPVADKIWKLLSANSILLSLCCIPVACCIICTHLKWLLTTSQQNFASLPTRLTQIYETVIRVCIFTRDHEYKGKEFHGTEVFSSSQEETLSKLGSLAKEGIEKKQQRFRARDVHGMENCGLLHRLPDSQISPYEFEENFCFLQLSCQKFLAARELAKKEPSELSAFILSKSSDPKWHLVIQFVAGLLHGKKNEAVDTFVNLLCECLTAKPPVESETKLKALLMMKCLYEYNDETAVQKAADELKNSEFKNKIELSQFSENQTYQVTPFDCAAIGYFMTYFENAVLNLGCNSIASKGVSYLCDALSDGNCKLTKLDLRGNQIEDKDVEYLCKALDVGNCTLIKLSLGANKLTNIKADSWRALMKSKLTTLDLSHNKINQQGVENLCKALKDENCGLKVVNLSYNNIGNDGLKHLHDVLTDPKCKLTKLYLCKSKIDDHGVSQLCHALKHSSCNLAKLNLSHNNITHQGLSDLADALKVGKCKLLKLDLTKIKITDPDSILQLCDALKVKNCKLVKLALGFNKLSDQCVSHLCDALKDCKLTKLGLAYNDITDIGLSQLCDVVKDVNNCHLVKLDLTKNKITDQGILLLCDAVKDKNCKLTDVRVKFNVNVTDQGYKMLEEALQIKQSIILQMFEQGCLVM